MKLDEAKEIPTGSSRVTKVVYRDDVYDFGYVSQTGHLVIYQEGECNMQDAVAVPPEDVALLEELPEGWRARTPNACSHYFEKDGRSSLCGLGFRDGSWTSVGSTRCSHCQKNHRLPGWEPGDVRVIVPIQERPELPPGWEWSPECECLDLARPWWRALGPKVNGNRVEAWGRRIEEDTPEWCARVAWKAWEALSGLTQEDCRRLKASPFLGCWPSRCPHCAVEAVADNDPPRCWWDHDGNCSACGKHPFTASVEVLRGADGLLPEGG